MTLIQSAHIEEIKSMLTITSTGDRPFTLELYKSHADSRFLYVPRMICKMVNNNLVILTTAQRDCIIESKIKATAIQEQLMDEWMMKEGNGIIQAPTGTGKTVMGIHVACRTHYPTLIIVPTDAIMTQWVARIKQFTNCKDKDIGIIKQNRCEYEGKAFVIGMVHTLAKADARFPVDIYNYFGLVIYDEVHTLGAETFSKVAGLFNSHYRLGLSATPRRKDGMQNVFLYHIGPVIKAEMTIPMKPKVIVINYYNLKTHHKGCVWGGKLSLGKYMNKLVAVKERTKRICDYVMKAFSKDHDILVLTDRLEQIADLKVDLVGRGVDVSLIGKITNKTKQIDRKILLATYGSAGMGLDLPRLTCLILATPRADIEQAVGRVVRKADKKQPVVIDFVDYSSQIMQGWAGARMKLYKKYTDTIQIITEKY